MVAEQDISNSITSLAATEPSLNEGFCIAQPWHFNRSTGLVYHNGVGVGLYHSGNQVVGSQRQLHVVTVKTFGFPLAVQTNGQHNLVVFFSELDSTADLLVSIKDFGHSEAQTTSTTKVNLVVFSSSESRSRAEFNLDLVGFSFLQFDSASEFSRTTVEEEGTGDLLGLVVNHELVVNIQQGSTPNSQPKLVFCGLIHNQIAKDVNVEQVTF